MTRKYEMVYILSSTLADEALAAAHQRVNEIVSSQASVESFDDWGRRRFAYEIQDEKEGSYAVLTFTGSTECPQEIDRVMKITPNVLRHLIVKLED